MSAEPQPAASHARNRRSEPRWRTRLQSGKILDSRNKILIDCQVHDRSNRGARLRIPVSAKLPSRFRFFDDTTKLLFDVQIAWQRGQDAGVRFVGQIHLNETQCETLSAKLNTIHSIPGKG